MSFTLHDIGTEGFEFSSNIWNWKAALEIIKSMDLISEGTLRQMAYSGTGFKVSQEDANYIGEKLQNNILPKLGPGKRIYADLSVTDKPDDGTLYRDEDEQWKNYSVSYDWLKEFSEFCIKCKGFQIY